MSNEKQLEDLQAASASTETVQRLRKALEDAQSAENVASVNAGAARSTSERHAKLKASADRLREKAEAEAFGARFNRNLLAAMKSGSTNVVDMLGAAMDAAGVGHVDRVTGVVSNAPRGLDVVAAEAELQSPGDFPIIIKARTIRAAERALDNLKRDIAAREAPEKIAEPAPPAYSVEERKVRAGIARRFGPLLWPTWSQMSPLPEPEAVFNAVEVRIAAQALVEKTRQDIRDAALEEADRAGMSLRQYGTVADRYDSEGLKAAARTGWNAGANEVLAAIRALKSKPAPPSSASYGDFGWALQQLLAGKRVKQGDSPRSWRMREDGALVDQNGIVMRELHMDMVLAMNWRLAE